jgi:PAS domain S-box-containing protein
MRSFIIEWILAQVRKMPRKNYIPPAVVVQSLGTLVTESQYRTVVDHERRYIEVSDGFCELVGYERGELIGTKYDNLTASSTSDIPTVFDLFMKSGYMHGLWMLVTRSGANILVRYESWIRSDSLIEGRMEVVHLLGKAKSGIEVLLN